jgi:hypothetical protein
MPCATVLAYLQGQDAYSVDDCLKICLEHGIQVGARSGAYVAGGWGPWGWGPWGWRWVVGGGVEAGPGAGAGGSPAT